MKKKQLLISLSLIGAVAITGCNNVGSSNSTSPATVSAKSNSVALDNVSNYPIGNILKYVVKDSDGGSTAYEPDADAGNGILGFYIQNDVNAFNGDPDAEAGKLSMLIPDSEKAYFNKKMDSLAPGEYPEPGNQLAPENVQAAQLDFKNGAWQLSQDGTDTGNHNMFFKYKDPATGDDVYFKLVSEVKTSSANAIENALRDSQGVDATKSGGLQNIYVEQPLKATLMTVASVFEAVLGGTALYGGNIKSFAAAGATEGGDLGKMARYSRHFAGVNKAKFRQWAQNEGFNVKDPNWSKKAYAAARNDAIYFNNEASSLYSQGDLSGVKFYKDWKVFAGGATKASLLRTGYNALGLVAVANAGFNVWYLSTNSSLKDNGTAPLANASRVLAGSDTDPVLTYRQVHLEPVSAADVAQYPELGLQTSKSVTPNIYSSAASQVVGFASSKNTTDAPSIMVSMDMLDTVFNPKPTEAPDAKRPEYIGWLKNDGYLGDRMPNMNTRKTNHYLDAALYLQVSTPDQFALRSSMPIMYGEEAARKAGYKFNGYKGSAPDINILSMSNNVGDTQHTLSANHDALTNGLSYVNKDGLKIYNAINLQYGDKLVLGVKNTSTTPMANVASTILNTDNGYQIFTAQTLSRLSKDRQMLLSSNGCSNLPQNNTCKLTLEAAKLDKDATFTGVLSINDVATGGTSTLVPFTYGVKTVLTPSVLTVPFGDDEIEGKFMNLGKNAIESVTFSRGDLPAKAKVDFKCYTADNKLVTNGTLPGGGYCKMMLDNLSAVRAGLYRMTISSNGVDIQSIPVQI
ncbi:MAG: hypothetical protein K2Q03_00560 [Sphingobacteriaceae bacterium]|nr:hypothetical protein [Sphingobacteriaceae bacterium]